MRQALQPVQLIDALDLCPYAHARGKRAGLRCVKGVSPRELCEANTREIRDAALGIHPMSGRVRDIS